LALPRGYTQTFDRLAIHDPGIVDHDIRNPELHDNALARSYGTLSILEIGRNSVEYRTASKQQSSSFGQSWRSAGEQD
jgi:hypothetical protein